MYIIIIIPHDRHLFWKIVQPKVSRMLYYYEITTSCKANDVNQLL